MVDIVHIFIPIFDMNDFLHSLDVFTVPTTYQEPKGRFALEAMACGVPLVLPEHGAFPELIRETGAGLLVTPGQPEQLAERLHRLLDDPQQRMQQGRAGREAAKTVRSAEAMARSTQQVYERVRAEFSSSG